MKQFNPSCNWGKSQSGKKYPPSFHNTAEKVRMDVYIKNGSCNNTTIILIKNSQCSLWYKKIMDRNVESPGKLTELIKVTVVTKSKFNKIVNVMGFISCTN